MNKENITVNLEKPETNSTVSENVPDANPYFFDAGVKGVLATKEVRDAIERHVVVPKVFIVKKIKKPFENKETKEKTQKMEVMSGTTLENAVNFEVTLLNTQLDPVEAINKKYRIIDYTIGLKAIMNKEDKFSGYAATGLKLVVTRLEEVK